MRLVEDQQMIQTFPAHGADESFRERIRPRRAHRRADHPGTAGGEDRVEGCDRTGVRVNNAVMDVELLVVPDCPNETAAAALLRTALDDIGLPGLMFRTTVIATQDSAAQRAFTGSPTFLIDGTDPFAVTSCEPAVACRVYSGPDGLTGVPELPALRRALKRHAAVGMGLPSH